MDYTSFERNPEAYATVHGNITTVYIVRHKEEEVSKAIEHLNKSLKVFT